MLQIKLVSSQLKIKTLPTYLLVKYYFWWIQNFIDNNNDKKWLYTMFLSVTFTRLIFYLIRLIMTGTNLKKLYRVYTDAVFISIFFSNLV